MSAVTGPVLFCILIKDLKSEVVLTELVDTRCQHLVDK